MGNVAFNFDINYGNGWPILQYNERSLYRSSNLSFLGLEEFLLRHVLGMLRGNALLVV